jgi:protein O-mannosyl-transferase
LIAQHRSHSISSLDIFPLNLRLKNGVISYALYAWKLVWPSGLAFFYPWPSRATAVWETAVAAVFFAGIIAIAWKQKERRPYLMAGWLWFVGTLIPVIGIVQVGSQARADRYAYAPMIGVLVAGVWLLADLVRGKPKQFTAGMAIAIVVALSFAAATGRQISYWRSDFDLWLHAFQVTRDNYLAADKVGVALQRQGRYADALPYFEQALSINAVDPLANFNVGTSLHLRGQVRDAIALYQITAGQDTDPILRAEAFENMGTAYHQLGDDQHARDSYMKALHYDPARTRIYIALREIESVSDR